MREGNPLEPNTKLCERMLSPYNLEVAVQNVKRNKGSAGVDGMGVEEMLETTDFNQKMTTDFNQYKCHRIQPISKMQ